MLQDVFVPYPFIQMKVKHIITLLEQLNPESTMSTLHEYHTTLGTWSKLEIHIPLNSDVLPLANDNYTIKHQGIIHDDLY